MRQKSFLSSFSIPVISILVAAGVALSQRSSGQPLPESSPGASPSPGTTPIVSPQSGQRIIYEAQLFSANPGYSTASAVVTIVEDGNQVGFHVQGTGLGPDTMQLQHVHVGSACATLANDTNQDGIIDAVEATAAAGPPALPLTLDIAQLSQNSSIGTSESSGNYPFSDGNGRFQYIASVSKNILQNALNSQASGGTASPTATPSGGVSGESILDGRVIEIHGLRAGIQLPDSVQALPGTTPNASFPVACGVITRVS